MVSWAFWRTIWTMPLCSLCCRPLKTRGTLAKHKRQFHDGKSMDDSVPPECVSLPYFLNLFQQPLKCPLCPFVRERCKNAKAIATHFRQQHPYHQLCVAYHCQWCDAHIDLTLIPRRFGFMFMLMRFTGLLAYRLTLQPPTLTRLMGPSRSTTLRGIFTTRRVSPIFHLVAFPPLLHPSPSCPPPPARCG